MKIWSPDHVDPEFEMTPMIDVVFLLIAFFMTLMSFITAELIELELPIAEESSIPEDSGERQYISVDPNGVVFFGSNPTTYDSLPNQLRTMRERMPQVKLYLRADATTQHRHINDVMSACAQAGIYDLIFASSQE